MGFLDKITDSLLGIPGKLVGGVIDLGTSFLGNELIGKPNAASAFGQSQEAYETQYANYKRRYRDTMKDMQKAGLNPILAAGSGGFNVGNTPQFSNVGQMPNYQQLSGSSAYANLMSGEKAGEEKKSEQYKQLKMLAEVKKTIAETVNERLKKGLIKEREKLLAVQVTESLARTGKMFHEVLKLGSETDLNIEQRMKIKNQVKILVQQLKQLKQTSDWYDGAYGDALGWIRATLGAFGSIFGPLFSALPK